MGSSDESHPPGQPLPPIVTVDFYPVSDEAGSPQNGEIPAFNLESITIPPSAIQESALQETEPSNSTGSLTPPTQSQGSESDQEDEVPLGTVLRQHAVPHVDRDKFFWPSQLLREVFTVELITAELNKYADSHPKNYRSSSNRRLAERIVSKHLVVFALLCLISKGVCIRQCIDEDVKDDDLPFLMAGTDGSLYRARDPTRPIQSFQRSSMKRVTWEFHDRDYIRQHQDWFNPVVFGLGSTGQAHHAEFTTEVILPFVQPQISRETQEGGFATVDMVQVHPYCHRFGDIVPSIKSKDLFAMKKLTVRSNLTERQRQQEFENEVAMLNRFAHLRHDHLVRLLASWTRPRSSIREYCLLFPLARCDLDLYWEEYSMDHTNIRWIAKQVLGLTDALKSIHDPPSDRLKPEDQRKYGRHGDLKPDNILWYDSSRDKLGILVIADLGSSAVNSLWSRSAVGNKTIQHTPRYKPPECDLEGGTISRSYDIWTFGCILLELVCWCLEGKNGRQAFQLERFAPYPTGCQTDMFFDMKPALDGRYVVLVKEAVTQKLASLHHHKSCTMFIHDLLYLIGEQMIVAVSKTTNRITSAKLYDQIRDMNLRMEMDSNYYQKPCAMPRPTKQFDPVYAVFQNNIVEQIQGRMQGLDVHRGPTQRTKSVQQLQDMAHE